MNKDNWRINYFKQADKGLEDNIIWQREVGNIFKDNNVDNIEELFEMDYTWVDYLLDKAEELGFYFE